MFSFILFFFCVCMDRKPKTLNKPVLPQLNNILAKVQNLVDKDKVRFVLLLYTFIIGDNKNAI